jgi:hypothetical protein
MALIQINAVSALRGKHLQHRRLPVLRAPAPWDSSTMMQERAIAVINLSSLAIAEQPRGAVQAAVAARVVNYPGL